MPKKIVEFNKFSLPNIESSITGETETEYFPLNPITDSNHIQFDIQESHTQLTDPHFLLKINAKIVKSDGNDLEDKARVGPVNLLLHALFKDVVLKANGVIISQANGTYPYRAYFETVLSYSSLAKDAAIGGPQLMFYKDQKGLFNGVLEGVNNAFDARLGKFVKSKQVTMAGRLHCDLLLQNKLIIPGVKFSISLLPSSSNFTLMSTGTDGKEKLVITGASIKMRRINMTSASILTIEKALQTKPANYCVAHATVRTVQLAAGTSQVSNLVLHSGQVPRCILMTTVSTSAFTGSHAHSPFNFSWEDCIQAQIAVDGKFSYNGSPIDLYLNILRTARKLYTDSNINVTYDDFLQEGYQVIPFDLSVEEGGIPPKRTGTVTFSGQWGPTDITHATTILHGLG